MQNGNTVLNKIYRKGLYYDFDEPMVILAELPGHNPFVKFTKFLNRIMKIMKIKLFADRITNIMKFI